MTSETKVWLIPDSAARTQLTKDYCLSVWEAAQPRVRQVCLTKSYCFVSSYSCSVLFADFKQMKISLMLLLGRELCCPKAERGSTLRLSDVGGVQSRSVWVCFPLEACHSPHVIEQHREKRKNSPSGIHLPSLFCLGTLDTPPPPLRTHTHTYPNTYCCHDCMHTDNMSSYAKMRTHRDKTHKHIPAWTCTRKYTTQRHIQHTN